MNNQVQVPVAGVVIGDGEGRYLVVQEKNPKAYGLWNLPAGWQDKGETLQQTAIREAKEEIGLDVELWIDHPLVSMANDTGERMLHSFFAKVVGGELSPQIEELLDAKWLTLEEVETLSKESKLRNRWTLESIRKAIEIDNENNRG